jgi:hypothetical protein
MLSRIRTSIALSLLATTALFAGCVIGRGDIDDDDTPTTTTTTTSSSTSGGGGEGGAGVGGSGGAGVGGSGGSGGGTACVGVNGTGLDDKSCDNMNITPAPNGQAASICDDTGGTGGTNPPPGYAACQHGFDVFNPGPAEHFQKCLAMITVEPANACSLDKLQDCVNSMYAATCEVPETTDLCDQIGKACVMAGQTFDVPGCAVDLKPFNQKALTAYSDCFDGEPMNVLCQDAHDKCFVAQL